MNDDKEIFLVFFFDFIHEQRSVLKYTNLFLSCSYAIFNDESHYDKMW